MELSLLRELNAERLARRAAVLATNVATGEQRLVREGDVGRDPAGEAIGRAIRSGKSVTLASEGGDVFLNVHVPPPRIAVIGAVHISQALAPMARLAGYDVAIIDPRTAFASPERFPGLELLAEWPQEAMRRRPLDRYTALVAVTHDPKIDDAPIAEALRAGCFYVGALGSRKTHARRVERLREAGMVDAEIARIEAPIGLDIGASSPGEIAVAVLASVIAAFRKRIVEAGRTGERGPA